jgi:hypothetical protein
VNNTRKERDKRWVGWLKLMLLSPSGKILVRCAANHMSKRNPPTNVMRALEKRKLVEHVGELWFKITPEGRAAVVRFNNHGVMDWKDYDGP